MRKHLFLMLCVLTALLVVGCGATQAEPEVVEENKTEEPRELVAKHLNDYSWDELSRISEEIGSAESEDSAREIARKYELIDEDNRISTETKQILLDDSITYDVRLAGIWHDDRSDGTGKAGLTFMIVGALDKRPMNEEDTIEGGWEQSSLRSWLNGDAKKRFSKDLRKAIVAVDKLTNNMGITQDTQNVTATSDELWAFSAAEVCGELHWDEDEYQHKRGYVEDIDGMLNAEGYQYEMFQDAGVSDASDPNGILSLANSTGKMPWWYRTPYPFDWQGLGDTGTTGYFCQVRDSGYPESLGSPSVPAGVVVAFCV